MLCMTQPPDPGPGDRATRAAAVYARLFGERDPADLDAHPEFGDIVRRVVFGDVFATGDLDDRTRELIPITCLASIQALPQLRIHTAAALRVGVTPVELTEAVYQLAPYLGFPRALNALAVVTEVLTEHGVELPLPRQGTVTEADRHTRGQQIQEGLYGTEIATALADLPGEFATSVPAFLTDLLFGDFYTRGGLDVATRELLSLVALAAAGLAPQLTPHARVAVAAGNSVERVLAALVQAFPYIGFPSALNAIRQVPLGQPGILGATGNN